jgi:O-succinylbenzoic acid--CoA ligase
MELIIEEGKVTMAMRLFPEIEAWANDWLSEKTTFDFMTSGTTGTKKVLTFSREQLHSSAERTCRYFHLHHGTTVLHRLPMQFVAGKMNIIRALMFGHSVWAEIPSMHFNSDWNAAGLRWDWWTTTPAMMTAFLEAKCDVNVFKKILLGGGKVQSELSLLLNAFKGECFESYGATETLTHIAIRSVKPQNSSFHLMPGVSVFPKDDGLDILDDLINIQAHLNDVVHFTGPDSFQVLGRADDVINSGGLKIYPLLVEEILSPWISTPFYISKLPDPKWGNVVTLVVEQTEVEYWLHLDWKEIFRDQPNWKPKIIITVQKIEINENGKVVRKYNPEGLVNRLQ